MLIIRIDQYEEMDISNCLCVLFSKFDAVIKCLISFGPKDISFSLVNLWFKLFVSRGNPAGCSFAHTCISDDSLTFITFHVYLTDPVTYTLKFAIFIQ